MQTNPVGTTWTLGNHRLTDAEAAAGLPQRDPFYDADGLPGDPDEVRLTVTDPMGVTSTYGWPTPEPGDAGALEQQETGRFFVAVTPLEGEDGLWRWWLRGAMTLGTAASDQDVFYVQREIAPGP